MSTKFANLLSAVATMEGFFLPGTPAVNNNNPGNLTACALPRKKAGIFVVFNSPAEGAAALATQFSLYAQRGLTLRQAMNLYAPVGHGNNNPEVYINFITEHTGIEADTLLNSLFELHNLREAHNES